MKKISIKYLVLLLVVFNACSKGSNTPNGSGINGGGNNGGNEEKTNCIISAISQVNSGQGAESSLSAFYNSNFEVIKLVVYDSVSKIKNFEASFNYVSPDSVRLNQYQYFILDAGKRVVRFATKSDMSYAANADNYMFEYIYNSEGYLSTKNLYINGSKTANFKTAYTYNNNLLTGCTMTAVSSGNLKVLESTFTYDNTISIKNFIYTFPDAIEGYEYLTALNFGNRTSKALKQIITKVYDPASANLLDTWTTNYGNYTVDKNGYVLSGEANGDLQQGIAAFYGKTNFYYTCH